MMLVVADTSPIIALVQIGHVEILPDLFERVMIPPQVAAELRAGSRANIVQLFMKAPPAWLLERSPGHVESIATIDAGEEAAISLALEVGPDFLLMDEASGRREAHRRGIRVIGTIGILELAASRGLIDFEQAIQRIQKTDFWISREFLDRILAQWRAKKGNAP